MRHLSTVLLLCAATLAASCATPMRTFDTPVPADRTFEVGAPGGEELARLRKAAAWSADHEGLALIVLKDDAIVFEDYANGHRLETPVHLFGATRAFGCLMAAAAVGDGALDLDAPVYPALPGWEDDPYKVEITARHLLSLTSGLEQDFRRLTWDGQRALPRVPDTATLALSLGADVAAGEGFQYGDAHHVVFAEVLRRKLGLDPLGWIQKRVFDPIGLHYSGWSRDERGLPHLGFGVWITAREWARLGVLLRDDGAFYGRQVLPPGLLAQCRIGSQAMPAYGLSLWLNTPVTVEQRATLPPAFGLGEGGPLLYGGAPADLFAAAGHHDQRLYVIPSRGLVIVRLGAGDDDFRDATFLGILLDGREP